MIVSEKNNFCFILRIVSRAFAVWILLLPIAVSAQSLAVKTAKAAYRVGDSFQASLSINTGGQIINTISGKVAVPTEFFELRDLRYGSSILSLWVEKPSIDRERGVINFSGGVPGGFSGSAGPVLSFGLKAKRSGATVISVSDIKVLLNDGIGTEMQNVTTQPLRLAITEAPLPKPVPAKEPSPAEEVPSEEPSIPPPDTVPPEEFTPLVSRHPSIGDNAYFVSFFAVDKDTGVLRYDVAETPYLFGRFAEKFNVVSGSLQNPPYILRYQHWPTGVIVRAYDQAGNVREGWAEKSASPLLILIVSGIFAALAAAGSYFYAKRGRMRIRRKIYDIKPQ